MQGSNGPQPLGLALSELIALRGLARVRSESQLTELWEQIAGEQWAAKTRVSGIRRGVLQVRVTSAPLRSELEGFHKAKLLERLQQEAPHISIRDVKFVLQRNVR